MRNNQFHSWISALVKRSLALVCGVVFAGCSAASRPALTPQQPPPAPQAELNRALTVLAQHSTAASADYQIGPQDMLQITLYNVPATETGVTPRTTDVQVSQQGIIALPLLGEIRVTGLTVAAVEGELRLRYATYLHEPQVGVLVKEYRSQRVSVIGAVQHPGVFALAGPKTLIDVLALATA